MFSILQTTLRVLLASFLCSKSPLDSATPVKFQLRHQLAASNGSRLLVSDISPSFTADTYVLHTQSLETYRPSSYAAFSHARLRSMRYMQSEQLLWEGIEIPGPRVHSRETLLELAKMTHNSYYETGHQEWYDLGTGWHADFPFGWEPDADGFRGHVFVSDDNSTVVISVKGTSAGWIVGGGGATVKKDKLNDNLLFSCCCAKVGPTWTPVCDCHSGGYKCDLSCLQEALIEESLFYHVGINLYNNVSYMYPDAAIWMTGHSLGGSLAALIGITFGVPVVAFQAPGEKLAAARLHLPSPPSTNHITHVIHTADPIAMGTCTGITSVCGMGGYAMESRCHLGKVAWYDTVTKRGWSVDSRTHSIKVVIDKVLNEDWEPPASDGTRREVPDLEEQNDCIDCFNWEFGDYQNRSLTSSSSC